MFDNLAGVLVQLLGGIDALVRAVVPEPGQSIFGGSVDCCGNLRRRRIEANLEPKRINIE